MTKIFVEESDLDYDPAVVANILVDSNSSNAQVEEAFYSIPLDEADAVFHMVAGEVSTPKYALKLITSILEKDAPNSVLLTELKNHPNMQ